MATAEDFVPSETATAKELHAELDSLAQQRLGMAGDEFIAALTAGKLDPYSPTVSRLAILARLIR
jgi:hypothetical protein